MDKTELKRKYALRTLVVIFVALLCVAVAIWNGANPYGFMVILFALSSVISFTSYIDNRRSFAHLLELVASIFATIFTIYHFFYFT